MIRDLVKLSVSLVTPPSPGTHYSFMAEKIRKPTRHVRNEYLMIIELPL